MGHLFTFVAIDNDDVVAELLFSMLSKSWGCSHPDGKGEGKTPEEAIRTAVSDPHLADSLVGALTSDVTCIGQIPSYSGTAMPAMVDILIKNAKKHFKSGGS